MSSNVSKGNYYLKKSKEFLEKEGYNIEKLEKLTGVFIKGKVLWRKNDMLFSDLLAWNKKEVILIQVKGGEKVQYKKAIENYKKLKIPLKKVVMVWRPRIRIPEWIEV